MPATTEVLRRVSLFSSLSEAERADLARLLGRRVFAKGAMIMHKGAPGDALHIIESGSVRVFLTSDLGQEVTINACGPGEVLGELSLLDGLPHSASVMAVDHTVTLTLQAADFLEFLRTHVEAARDIMRILATRLRYATVFAESLVFLDVPGRVAARLLELSAWRAAPDAGAQVTLNLNQAELARWVASTRETVNKVLHDFAAEGLLRVSGQEIIILDRRALQRKVLA